MKKSFVATLVANILVLVWVVVRGLSDMAAVNFQDLPWDVLVVVPAAAFILLRFFGQLVAGLATRAPADPRVQGGLQPKANGTPLGDPPTTGTAVGKPWVDQPTPPMGELVGGPFNGQRLPAPAPGEDLVVTLGNSKVVYKLGSDGRWWFAKGK